MNVRLRLYITEISIHTVRVLTVKAFNRVLYVDTSKMKLLVAKY